MPVVSAMSIIYTRKVRTITDRVLDLILVKTLPKNVLWVGDSLSGHEGEATMLNIKLWLFKTCEMPFAMVTSDSLIWVGVPAPCIIVTATIVIQYLIFRVF